MNAQTLAGTIMDPDTLSYSKLAEMREKGVKDVIVAFGGPLFDTLIGKIGKPEERFKNAEGKFEQYGLMGGITFWRYIGEGGKDPVAELADWKNRNGEDWWVLT